MIYVHFMCSDSIDDPNTEKIGVKTYSWIISLFGLVLSLRAGEPLSETAVIHRPQDLKLETSNLVHNLGLGLAYQKTTFRIKIGGLGMRASKKNWDPLRIFATVEARNFKFGTQLGFGTIAYQKTFW